NLDEDTAAELFNYPSIGRLFESGTTDDLDALMDGYRKASNDLDLVIRKGSQEEAQSAAHAQKAIAVTLEFLSDLEAKAKS
ncbi:MAG: hypothetical protein HKN33_04395, partial [Pyrinomonadaceae bacterium]|nr:hypothetical protein [Pyrinomonadaceae bacterium]